MKSSARLRLASLVTYVPIVSNVQELDAGPRRFLFFIVFNVIAWQCVVGPVLALFALKIKMPPSWIGFLIAFMPFTMVLVVATGPLLTRLGSKRVMFGAWLLRNLFACTVFAMPWAVVRWGPHAAWYVLLGATLGYCLMRAVGAGGWFPWLHELVPERQRGAYFSAEASVAQLLNIGVALGQAFVLRGEPTVTRFLLVYSAGICAGFASLGWMYRIPGGARAQGEAAVHGGFETLRVALRDAPFVKFVVTASLCFSCLSLLGTALLLYMPEMLHVSSDKVMALMALGSVGIMMTVRSWARFAEHSGSAPAMFLSLAAHSAMALACLGLIPGAVWTRYMLVPVLVFSSAFNAAYGITTNRAMLDYIQVSDRVGYTNVWIVITSLAVGITPILAGAIIEYWGLWGFRLCFAISGIAGFGCAAANLWAAQGDERGEWSLSSLKHPRALLRVLSSIVLITLGVHASKRKSIPGN